LGIEKNENTVIILSQCGNIDLKIAVRCIFKVASALENGGISSLHLPCFKFQQAVWNQNLLPSSLCRPMQHYVSIF